MLKDLIQQHLSYKRMKYDLTRIVNESFTIELRLIATNFLRLVSWIPTWCVVAIHEEVGARLLLSHNLDPDPKLIYCSPTLARIMLYCGTNEILIYRAPAILPQKMSVIGKKWQCSVHQDWLIMMSDEDKEFFSSYLNRIMI